MLRLLVVVACFIAVSSCLSTPFQKGMSYTDGYSNIVPFDSEESKTSLENMINTNIDWLAVRASWFVDTINDTDVHPIQGSTSTDESIVGLIRYAHAKGVKIMLKPHLDVKDGTWRALIGSYFTDEEWKEWFASYTHFILHMAKLAESVKTEQFSVGVEMITASSHEKEWREIIAAVRNVYSGTVTYAANWGTKYQALPPINGDTESSSLGGELETVKWLDALDILGVDAYYYLTKNAMPTYQDLIEGWKPIVSHLGDVSKKWNKDIIFTEIGYRSIVSSAVHPAWFNTTFPINETQQALCYRAAFESFHPEPWWKGIFWWIWWTNPNEGGATDSSFTPQNKQAQKVLKELYANA